MRTPRNAQADGSGWSPLGSGQKDDVFVFPAWRDKQWPAQEQHDLAVIILKERVGDKLGGWFSLPSQEWVDAERQQQRRQQEDQQTRRHLDQQQGNKFESPAGPASSTSSNYDTSSTTKLGAGLKGSSQQRLKLHSHPTRNLQLTAPAPAPANGNPAAGSSPSSGLASASALGHLLGSDDALRVAGYPDDRLNGSMWTQECRPVRWGFMRELLWHGCATRGGNSGSPLFVSTGGGASGGGGERRLGGSHGEAAVVVAMHVASQKVPQGSQLSGQLEAELGAAGLPAMVTKWKDGSGEEQDMLVVPLALPLVGDLLQWVKKTIAEHSCPSSG